MNKRTLPSKPQEESITKKPIELKAYSYPRTDKRRKPDNSCFIISAIVGISSLPYFHNHTFLDSLPEGGPWNLLAQASSLSFPSERRSKNDYQCGLEVYFNLKDHVNNHWKASQGTQQQMSGEFQQPCGTWLLSLFDFFAFRYQEMRDTLTPAYDIRDAKAFNNYLESRDCFFSALDSVLVRRTQLHCGFCKKTSTTYQHLDPYIVIDLGPNSNMIDESTIANGFHTVELVDYKCDRTKKDRFNCEARKTTQIFHYKQMPRFLILEISRGVAQTVENNIQISDQVKRITQSL